ncbi:hypothetical protein pdam_00012277 [Pocillopora damicornis]|uniref:Fibrinogen C-terminal domain-containing protein n=1 Tax=Pocillopora damicornis TaxID=46731 RepID=A0A3M6T9F6_POCDA|nr:hypothetical protein pdam_00012277 [Pocillopora damicornis]
MLSSTPAPSTSYENNNKGSEKSKNCAEVFKGSQRISGVYTIYPDDKAPFDVYCDQTTAGGGWTVI